ncbi:RND family transporter [Acidobacteriota bacterium]
MNRLGPVLSNILRGLCISSSRHPFIWLFLVLIVSLPAVYGTTKIGLNTSLTRLLPDHSPAASWTRKLRTITSEGGYFTIIFESQNREKLTAAIENTAAEVEKLEEVRSVDFKYPYDFIQYYRYLLIPDYYLEKIHDYVISLEAEYSPFTTDLLSGGEETEAKVEENRQELHSLLNYYSNLSKYHQSRDGRVMGMFILPDAGFTNLDATQNLYLTLNQIADKTSQEFGVWTAVGGSQINNLREYNVIKADLGRSVIIALTTICIVLLISFRSLLVLPVLFLPLGIGLLWAFSLVPVVVNDLNMITSFLLVILFGMGIDYSIHLLKRFQLELRSKPSPQALIDTYLSTGRSVIISGLTTALPLFLLTFSDFRGFSEFGLIGGGAIIMMLLAMLIVGPSTLIIGERMGIIKPMVPKFKKKRIPPFSVSILVAFLVVVSIVAIFTLLRFDYDFRNLGARVPEQKEFRERHGQVYTRSMSPAAIYVIPDLQTLDATLGIFKEKMNQANSTIERVASIRDFAPDDKETIERLEFIDQIKEELQGSWTRRIEDPQIMHWIEDLKNWESVQIQPEIVDLPQALKAGLMAKDDSGQFLLGVYPNVSRRHGKKAMAFTEELYGFEIPHKVKGPIGEMPIFAEILWIVTSEGPWIVAFTFLGVLLLVFIGYRSLKDTLWVVFPLVGGVILTLGIMAVPGLKLNFFNVVVIPALLGMGVDHGVHYYRRWKELDKNTAATHQELIGPLTTCTVTTMMGYFGMIFANQAGLQSIGKIACLGLGCIWLTSLILLPGILKVIEKRTPQQED